MKNDYNKYIDTIVLEVSGERDIVKYQKSLVEASLLGINRIMFCCVWGNDEKKGEEIFNKLVSNCKSLNIIPVSDVFGYEEEMFGETMIGKTDESGHLISFGKLISFDDYKISKGKFVEESSIDKVLTKIK